MLDGITEAILSGTKETGNNAPTEEQKAKMEAMTDFIVNWGKQSEHEKDNNLPSYDDLNEAFLEEDWNKLHDKALKLRVALSEIDANILSHIRMLIVLADSLAQYRGHPDDEDRLPNFLKAIPAEDRETFIQGVIISEVTGVALRTMEYDTEHQKEN